MRGRVIPGIERRATFGAKDLYMTTRKREYRFSVSLRTELGRPSVRDFGSFVDMMRYDQCTVSGSSVAEPGWIQVALKSDSPPTTARWNSFGLQVTED